MAHENSPPTFPQLGLPGVPDCLTEAWDTDAASLKTRVQWKDTALPVQAQNFPRPAEIGSALEIAPGLEESAL